MLLITTINWRAPNLGNKMWKISLQKIVADLLEKLRKLYMNRIAI